MNFLALGITGYFFFQLYHGENVPTGISHDPGRQPREGLQPLVLGPTRSATST